MRATHHHLTALGRPEQPLVTQAFALPLRGQRRIIEILIGQSIVACEIHIHFFDFTSYHYRHNLSTIEVCLSDSITTIFVIIDFASFFIGTAIIFVLQRPNSMFVMTAATRDGLGPRFLGNLDIFTDDSIFTMLAVETIASLIQTTPILFESLRLSDRGYWRG